MIYEWSLEAFKCIASKQTLGFRRLTVFAGANSSGKSTVLQSMLLLCQTLASKVERRQLLLNGDLVRLGTLDDILSQREERQPSEMTIGCKLQADPKLLDSIRAPQFAALMWAPWFRHQRHPGMVEVELHFGKSAAEPGADVRHAELVLGKFTAAPRERTTTEEKPGGSPDYSGHFTARRRAESEAQAILASNSSEQIPRENLEAALRYSAEIEPNPSPDMFPYFLHYLRNDQSLSIVGTSLYHFLPQALIARYSVVTEMVSAALDEYAEDPSSGRLDQWQADGNEVKRNLADILRQSPREETKSRPRRRHLLETRSPDLINQVRARLSDLELRDRTALTFLPGSYLTSLITSSILAEFAALRYLGPLRDEPRPLHDIGSGADPKDVGTRGEFTAAVLNLFGATSVDFVPPGNPSADIETRPLDEAVRLWLRHFDIAERIETKEEGKLGHRLYVFPGGIRGKLDLTNVGVGVSQVLPIVVMALISEPGSVLLFEQPELHLHPRVQSQLADFFLGVIRTGRQCIVETHSEYLVNRLRRRVAEAPWESAIGDEILLYFVSRNGSESSFQAIDINPYGAIPDWPEGFFDQGPAESESIVVASERKRAARQRPK
jgi:hypothetical protein